MPPRAQNGKFIFQDKGQKITDPNVLERLSRARVKALETRRANAKKRREAKQAELEAKKNAPGGSENHTRKARRREARELSREAREFLGRQLTKLSDSSDDPALGDGALLSEGALVDVLFNSDWFPAKVRKLTASVHVIYDSDGSREQMSREDARRRIRRRRADSKGDDDRRRRADSKGDDECPVCLELLREVDNVYRLPCDHTFCSSCVQDIIDKVDRGAASASRRGVLVACPMCRQEHRVDPASLSLSILGSQRKALLAALCKCGSTVTQHCKCEGRTDAVRALYQLTKATDDFSVRKMCLQIGISPRTFTRWKSRWKADGKA
jgi:hypothetical protein